MSILLTRKAGPRTNVVGEMQLAVYGSAENAALPTELTMNVGGRSIGRVLLGDATAKLSSAQVDAILGAVKGKARIEWRSESTSWHLSGEGAMAVLLKMDEVQGRLDTPGALARKGLRAEGAVLPPHPPPVVHAAPLSEAPFAMSPDQVVELRRELRVTIGESDDCTKLTHPRDGDGEQTLAFTRLRAGKFLVSTPCWVAAYNYGAGHWVTNDKQPYAPTLVTTLGTDIDGGTIGARHKGRGLGDCWSIKEWTWDGTHFVHTSSITSGMCRLIAAGGAWILPSLVTDVRGPKRALRRRQRIQLQREPWGRANSCRRSDPPTSP